MDPSPSPPPPPRSSLWGATSALFPLLSKVVQSILPLIALSAYMQIDKNMHYLDDEGNWPE